MIEKETINSWLSAFGSEVDRKIIREHVIANHNYLWHLFTWGGVPCLEGDEARKAFDALRYKEATLFCDRRSNRITDVSAVGKLSAKEIDEYPGSDVYIVAKDYSWTYVRTHESEFGPYFCVKK